MNRKQLRGVMVLILVATGVAQVSQAVILSSGVAETLMYGYHSGPGGGLDVNAVHYWSLDESGAPFMDAGSSSFLINMASESGLGDRDSVLNVEGGSFNGAQRIGTAGNGSQRISALAPTTNTLNDNISLDQTNSFFGADGAISVDMLIRTDFDSTYSSGSGMRLISQENDELNPQNLFFGYSPNIDELGHRLEFVIGGAAAAIPIPLSGDHALVDGGWYHVAASYDGNENTPGNVRMYWTRVQGPNDTTTQANEIAVTDAAMSGNPFFFTADPDILTAQPEFTFGNETNGTINKSFDGVLDAIRISNVARNADAFIFTSSVDLDGDFNHDGFVDAADYVTWRKGLGTEFEPEDYDLWAEHFGEPGEGGGATLGVNASLVPEPASLVLLLSIVAGLAKSRRSR